MIATPSSCRCTMRHSDGGGCYNLALVDHLANALPVPCPIIHRLDDSFTCHQSCHITFMFSLMTSKLPQWIVNMRVFTLLPLVVEFLFSALGRIIRQLRGLSNNGRLDTPSRDRDLEYSIVRCTYIHRFLPQPTLHWLTGFFHRLLQSSRAFCTVLVAWILPASVAMTRSLTSFSKIFLRAVTFQMKTVSQYTSNRCYPEKMIYNVLS